MRPAHASDPISHHERMPIIVIGAGQAGLALGYYLARRRLPFVILDGAPALGHSWRRRWDSLTLFTPAWHSHLPGLPLPLPPGAFPIKDDIADYLTRYAATFALPVRLNAPVVVARAASIGYEVRTGDTLYTAEQVALATGPYQRQAIPAFASQLAPGVVQIASSDYRNPGQVPPGEALIVGAGNSGLQIARELAATHAITLATGRPALAIPPRILGRDYFWWGERLGLTRLQRDGPLGRRFREMEPIIGASPRQLAREAGIRLAPRVVGAVGRSVLLADGRRLPVRTVIWATGYRSDYNWVQVPVFDASGQPMQWRGVSPLPGLTFLGLHWQHTSASSLVGGVGQDAAWLAAHIAARFHLDARREPPSP